MDKALREKIEKYKVEIDRAINSGYVFAMKYERKREIYDIYYEIHQMFNSSTSKFCASCYKSIYNWLIYIGEYYYKNLPKRGRNNKAEKDKE